MTHIENLPLAGAKFSAKSGLGSFQNKLSHGMRASGELSTFQRHPEAVKSLVDQVAKNQTYIRRGGLSHTQIEKIKKQVVKDDPSLTETGKKLIHKTLLHLRVRSHTPTEQPELPTHGRVSAEAKPGAFKFTPKAKPSQSITSLGNKAGKTASFHQFGDSVSRTKTGQRSDKVYGSVNAALKESKAALQSKETDPNAPVIPVIPQNDNDLLK